MKEQTNWNSYPQIHDYSVKQNKDYFTNKSMHSQYMDTYRIWNSNTKIKASNSLF